MVTAAAETLRILRVRFNLKAISEIRLGDYKGSTFRGVLGHALKSISCFSRRTCLTQCAYPKTCPYGYLFETPVPEGAEKMKKYSSAPHPFILTPPLEVKKVYWPGEFFHFDLTLVGKGVDYLPYFVYAFEKQGEKGMGKSRGFFEVVSVLGLNHRAENQAETLLYINTEKMLVKEAVEKTIDQFAFQEKLENKDNPPLLSSVKLQFLTPIRLKFEESLSHKLEFHILIRNLLRRLSSLLYFHEGIEVNWNFKELIEKALTVKKTEDKTYWYDWERYSNRQETRMKLGGLMGEAEYADVPSDFALFLKAGEIVHVGKNTSFGLGKYVVIEGSG
jgi:CRISPR-associated endoribonuclease Cas6